MATAEESPLTELAGVADAETEYAVAWALDDGDDIDLGRSARGVWITAGAVATSLLIAGGAAWVVVAHLSGTQRDPAPPVPVPSLIAAPTTTPPKPAPATTAPPTQTVVTTVIVQQPAPTIQAAPRPTTAPLWAYDDQFVSRMQAGGWIVEDRALFIQRAHETCNALRQGWTMQQLNYHLIAIDPRWNDPMRNQFLMTVVDTYPNCP